jgi:Zn finger protein HypA/HybF involved in hydrogenase expression
MGQVKPFACSACGYSGEATVGGTMSGFRTNDPFPAICGYSKEVVPVNMAKQPHKCAECGGSNFKLYGDETRSAASEAEVLAEWQRHEPDASGPFHALSKALFGAEGAAEHTRLFWDEGAHICPACGKHELRFSGPSLMFD